jgi:hypothetical protein
MTSTTLRWTPVPPPAITACDSCKVILARRFLANDGSVLTAPVRLRPSDEDWLERKAEDGSGCMREMLRALRVHGALTMWIGVAP